MDKPIAVLANTSSQGLEYCQKVLKAREINGGKMRAIGLKGEIYQVITTKRQAEGYQFSGIITVDNISFNTDMGELYNYVKLRMV